MRERLKGENAGMTNLLDIFSKFQHGKFTYHTRKKEKVNEQNLNNSHNVSMLQTQLKKGNPLPGLPKLIGPVLGPSMSLIRPSTLTKKISIVRFLMY
jgi:hypothetical protein